MSGARYPTLPFTLLGALGVLLVVANLGAILPAWQEFESRLAVDSHLVLAAISAGVTGLFTIALFSLARLLARTSRQQEAARTLLAAETRAQEEWQQTFNTMPDLVSVHDGDFRVIKANSALCDFLGKRPEEVIGRPCYQVFHDRDRPIDACPHAKARQVQHAVTMAINDPRLGVPLLVTCSPFVNQEGNFAGSVHIAKVQTDRAASTRNKPQPFIPICASCKDIRDENGHWMRIEDFVGRHCNGRLTHSICRECQRKIYPEFVGQ